ncbi:MULTISPECIES: hypothetical protein [Bizionia]|uniref:YD repeat-containing protein n=1 Tax=Bizionia algoritergicola TaxID=291187 RepID=A0A5D0R332_9FLAO|nr:MULTISPECIES: hypothetical protein [Bizionia]OBX21874.1 hypothetical protein BAA08_11030 [Bizionia sp. APA-3]TYB75028.1 hypothetical protein ES675_02525 [Bizionia algoritergicola]
MKKYLVIAVCILFASCSSDDDSNTDNSSQDNAPSGALIKVEVYQVFSETNTTASYFFNSNGRVSKLHSKAVNSNGEAEYITSFAYNSNNQIWKSTTEYNGSIDYTEFTFNNGLITSSYRYRNNGDILRALYDYNTSNQLISKEHFNADNILAATTDITFFTDGNIESTYFERDDGGIKGYTYEFDNKNNPQYEIFENQEIGKVDGINLNNVTKSYYSNDSSGATIDTTIEYTYNERGYPLTSNEYSQSGTLTAQVTYTYQE